jgi:hypothetical protein
VIFVVKTETFDLFYQNMPIIIIILLIYEYNMYTFSLTSNKVKVLSRWIAFNHIQPPEMNAYDCCDIQNMWRFGIHIGYGLDEHDEC